MSKRIKLADDFMVGGKAVYIAQLYKYVYL